MTAASGPRRILVLDGHPDPEPERYGHALAEAYARGARGAGHEVRCTQLAAMEFPALSSRADWEGAAPPAAARALQDEMAWAEHLVLIYPLWLGGMPARLKALLEQTFRPAFAFGGKAAAPGAGRLKGRSARIIVTMGMPAPVFRIFYLGHSLAALRRSILGLVGFGPIRDTVLGGIEIRRDREAVLRRIETLGARGL